MTPEEIQKEYFRLFNESMKNPLWDKTGATNKDMDDFMKINMIRLMDPSSWTGTASAPSMFKDNIKIQMRFAIETMKIQIQYLEKLMSDLHSQDQNERMGRD